MALFRGEVYFPVFTLTLFDKNSIKGHWNLIWLNLGSCNKGFIMIQRKQLSDTPTSPKSAGRQCQGFWISKGAEQMNRAFNKNSCIRILFSGLFSKSSRISDNATTDCIKYPRSCVAFITILRARVVSLAYTVCRTKWTNSHVLSRVCIVRDLK